MKSRSILTKLFSKVSRSVGLQSPFFDLKSLETVRFKTGSVRLGKQIRVQRPKGLVLGSDISLGDRLRLDATAGIALGDSVEVKEGVNISTFLNDTYAPVIVGSGNTVDGDILPGTIVPSQGVVDGLSTYAGQIVFIVSTGRSGSNAIAKILSSHNEAVCYHDSFPHLYSYSTAKLYDRESAKNIKENLRLLYDFCNMPKSKVHGQSDQKLSALIPELSILFPNAKFLWLLRRADSFVNSAYPRGWFANSEFGYQEPHPREFFKKQALPSAFDAYHRTNGCKCGVMSEIEWRSMTAFERNCWYWTYWNSMIEGHFADLDPNRTMMVRLEELDKRLAEVFSFIGLKKTVQIASKRTNEAKYKTLGRDQWNMEMEHLYEKWCASSMKKWFEK